MYKDDLALNNLQGLICHKTQPNCMINFCLLKCINIVSRVFANGPGDQGSIPGCVILKKWYLILPCLTLSNMRYVSRVKWSNPGKGVTPSPTSQCSSH